MHVSQPRKLLRGPVDSTCSGMVFVAFIGALPDPGPAASAATQKPALEDPANGTRYTCAGFNDQAARFAAAATIH